MFIKKIFFYLLQGLYRCHHCFLLCNEVSDLLRHLKSHNPPPPAAVLVKETDISVSGTEATPTSGPQKSRENTTEPTRAPSVAEDEYDLEDEPLVKRIKSPKTSKPSLSKPSTSEPSLCEPIEKKTSSPSKKQSKPSPPKPPTIKETSSGNLRNYRKPSKPMVK